MIVYRPLKTPFNTVLSARPVSPRTLQFILGTCVMHSRKHKVLMPSLIRPIGHGQYLPIDRLTKAHFSGFVISPVFQLAGADQPTLCKRRWKGSDLTATHAATYLVRIPAGDRDVYSACTPAVGPTQPPIEGVLEDLFLEIQRAGNESENWPPQSAGVKKSWTHTSTHRRRGA